MTGFVPATPGTSSGPPPGWYKDPSGAPALRWWDGRQWTAHARPNDPPAPAGQEPGGRHRGSASALDSQASWLAGARQGHPPASTPRPSARSPQAVTESSQSAVAAPGSGACRDRSPASGSPVKYRDPEIRANRGTRGGTLRFRYFNAACYLFTGLIILGLQAKIGWDFKLTLFGIAAIAYSGWVGLTKRSYWYGGISYTIPILAIIFAFFEAKQ